MDAGRWAESLGLEENEFRELFDLFVQAGRTDLNQLDKAIAGGDSEAAAEAAHSLKGAAANLDFEEIRLPAQQIEKCARENRLDGMQEIFLRLCDAFESAIRTFECRPRPHGPSP